MAKVSIQAKNKYAENVKDFKKAITALLSEERELAAKLIKNDLSQNINRLLLAGKNLDIVSYFVLMNQLSLSLLGVKLENGLNDARKCCYKAIIYLEEAVTRQIDAPLTEYQPNLDSIAEIDDKTRFKLVRKMGYTIETVEDGFGTNSKWKWSFVELYGRYAVVTKNLIDFKSLISKLDPRIDGYRERLSHLDLSKKLLEQAADSHRQKYELSTRRIDDMQLAINYLAALRRINIILGEAEKAEVTKKKIEIWKNKMEADIKEKKNKGI